MGVVLKVWPVPPPLNWDVHPDAELFDDDRKLFEAVKVSPDQGPRRDVNRLRRHGVVTRVRPWQGRLLSRVGLHLLFFAPVSAKDRAINMADDFAKEPLEVKRTGEEPRRGSRGERVGRHSPSLEKTKPGYK